MIIIKSDDEIRKISKASKIVAEILANIGDFIKPGITTKDLELFSESLIKKHGAIPAFKGYRGYPSSLCVSINDEVVHGIPSHKRTVKDGDIVSIDIGVVYRGFIGDAAKTYAVGKIKQEAVRLLAVTEESLYKGIKEAVPGKRVSDISHAIQSYVEGNGYSVVRTFVGHGVGRDLHEEPQIPNYGAPHKGPRLKRGMVLAIEPMVNIGGYEVKVLEDGWTAVTGDGTLSAHFEHTVLVTEGEPEVLTVLEN
ncbi:type I methionyl aminopeptidase [Candidatus Magnetomonas plexicatena]|uniref:type I methionyl aminopeptidase n=1 Tax=Candidatus Magnetomonas plexicatena TaxID=2552947 RepID=UPI001C770DDE|nr:type I methionyl aminopeptidase [Nitrospirales bacterium LBB_01]